MNWLEISLTLDGELAEAVAEVLARHAPNGVAIESTAFEVTPDDEGRPIGPMRVCAYLPADDPAALDATRLKIERDLFYLGLIQPIPQPTYTPIAETDWSELWKANYHPIRVGNRLLIVPAWLVDTYASPRPPAQPPDDILLIMDPGMAFGTGTHPTTQLCLALLETYLQPGDHVFDLGCGSGILSVAAAKLGAGAVLGMDIDPVAEQAARENAELNGVSERIEVRLGSLQQLAAGGQPPAFQIVVANILARVIINLLNEGLAQVLLPGATILLSGILAEQTESVLAAITAAGLQVIEQRLSREWVAIAARRT